MGRGRHHRLRRPVPKVPKGCATQLLKDVTCRAFMIKKIVLENQSDPIVRIMFGGNAFDFGEEVNQAARDLAQLDGSTDQITNN